VTEILQMPEAEKDGWIAYITHQNRIARTKK